MTGKKASAKKPKKTAGPSGRPVKMNDDEKTRQYCLALLLHRYRSRGERLTSDDIFERMYEFYFNSLEELNRYVDYRYYANRAAERKHSIKKDEQIEAIRNDNRKMLQRDLAKLKRLGIIVSKDEIGTGDFKYWIEPSGFSLAGTGFQGLNNVQIYLALQSIKEMGGPFFTDELRDIGIKLFHDLYPPQNSGTKEVLPAASDPLSLVSKQAMLIDLPTSARESLVKELFTDVKNAETIEFSYKGSKDRKYRKRKAKAVGMIYRWGEWHLVAFDLDAAEHRLFRISRMLGTRQDIKNKGAGETSPDDMKAIERYLSQRPWDMGDGDHTVKVKFKKAVLEEAKEELGPSIISDAKHGRTGETVEIRARSLEKLCDWLLNYGDDAELISPPEGREYLSEKAKRILSAMEA